MLRVWLFLKVDTTLVEASIVLRAGNYSTYSNGTDKCAECLLVKTGCHSCRLIVLFSALVHPVMTAKPYASARRVFWVADHGSSPAVRIKIIVNSMATTPEREPEGSDDQ